MKTNKKNTGTENKQIVQAKLEKTREARLNTCQMANLQANLEEVTSEVYELDHAYLLYLKTVRLSDNNEDDIEKIDAIQKELRTKIRQTNVTGKKLIDNLNSLRTILKACNEV